MQNRSQMRDAEGAAEDQRAQLTQHQDQCNRTMTRRAQPARREGLAPPSCQSSAPCAGEHQLQRNRARKLNQNTPPKSVGMLQRGRSAGTRTLLTLPAPCMHLSPKGLPDMMLFRMETPITFPFNVTLSGLGLPARAN